MSQPISIRILSEHGVVVTTWVGGVTDADMLDCYRSMYGSPEWRPGFHEVVDLREADVGQITVEGLNLVNELVLQSLDGFAGTSRTAIIAPRDLEFGMSRMYEALTSDGPESVRVFRDYSEALRWVGMPSDALPAEGD